MPLVLDKSFDGWSSGCSCQYGDFTPRWYISVKRCPIHAPDYAPELAPEWAWQCGPGGVEVLADKAVRVSVRPEGEQT